MFGACCRETVVKNQQLYLYKGSTNNLHNRMSVRQSRLNNLIEQTSQPFRIYVKSKMDKQVNALEDKQQYFTDQQFPPSQQSIGFYEGRQLTWKRLSQMYDQKEEGQYTTGDILAMKQKDRYFAASVAALATNQSFIRGIFDSDIQISKTGAYKLRLNYRGRPREEIIDDYLPVYRDNIYRGVFSRIVPDLIWLPLLEKAYAKIHGSYQNINMGYAHEVFTVCSMAPCLYQMIPTDFRMEEQDRCWNTIQEAYQCRFPIVFGSRRQFTCEDIVPHHSYCLKECVIFKRGSQLQRRVVLWNVPDKIGKIVNRNISSEQDGSVISLPLVEFMRNFEIIDTTHIRKHYNSYFYPFQTEASSHKFYSFEVHQRTNLYLTLIREKGQRARLRIILIHFTNQATYEYIEGKKEDIYSDVSIRLQKLPVGKYIIICESASKSDCLIRVYTPLNIALTKFEGNIVTLLEHTFFYMSCSQARERQKLSVEHNDWYYSKSMFDELGYGIFILSLDDRSAIEVQININKNELLGEGLRVINKMFKVHYCNRLQKGETDIFIFELDNTIVQAFAFPPNNLKIKMIV